MTSFFMSAYKSHVCKSTTCHANFIHLYLIILLIYEEVYKTLSFSLCNFLQCHVISSVFHLSQQFYSDWVASLLSPHITLRHTTLCRNPLDKRSVRRRDLYLTKHNIHKRQTSTLPGGISTCVPSKRLVAGQSLRPCG